MITSNEYGVVHINILTELTTQSHDPLSSVVGSGLVFELIDDSMLHFLKIRVSNSRIILENGSTYTGSDSIERFLNWCAAAQLI